MPNRIDTTLNRLRDAGQTALVPFITTGFPDLPTSESLAREILESGADMLELGIPFSDPLADGPTIQMTSYRALQNGTTLTSCLDTVRNLREAGVDAPLIFMGYYNPYFHYGLGNFLDDAADAGLDGMIVPDLPTEEAMQFSEMAEERGIHLIPLLAPTSSDQRIRDACESAGGFIYCVSLTGVTGARRSNPQSTPALVQRIRQHTDLPILVGFGVSRPEHIEEIASFADGAVVGSALLEAVDKAPEDGRLDAARNFIHSLKGTNSRGTALSKVRGLRGATTADSNTPEAILHATRELLEELVEANNVDTDDIAAVTFSVTRDLDAEFPAVAARVHMGWTGVAMMCGNEMNVPGGQERCIRVMILINTDKRPDQLEHIYLRGAANLRARSGKQS